MKYTDEVKLKKRFFGNVVIKTAGTYFCIHKPDSGLGILPEFVGTVASLILNPTQFDIRRVSTSIASNSFRLVDKRGVLTALVDGDADVFIGQDVEIWVGRTHLKDDQGNWIGEPMDFADYAKLPTTKVKACTFSDRSYDFKSTEETERIGRDIYQLKTRLAVNIVSGTDEISAQESIADWPASGFFKIDNEFISYASLNIGLNRFVGCIRGEFGSVPFAHQALDDVFFVEPVEENPLDLVLQLLTSGSGVGAYDVLEDGLGIDPALIDVTAIESLRDELFADDVVRFKFFQIDNALKFIEEQIFAPFNLRFTQSPNAKLTLVVLDRAKFVTTPEEIDESTIVGQPKWSVDAEKVVNVVEVNWDYNEVSQKYEGLDQYLDEPSIAKYGRRTALKYSFKGIKSDLDGQFQVDDFADRLLRRLSTPTPEITFTTQVDRSLKNIGDKTVLTTKTIPGSGGKLGFENEVEVTSRGINYQSGDVTFKVQFTSFTLLRGGYIAPARMIETVISQKIVGLSAGSGDLYEVGFRLRLWDEFGEAFAPDSFNEIVAIDGDELTFANDWTTTLTPGNFRLRFVDYDDATKAQKRYAFATDGANNFADGDAAYRVTY